MAPSPVKSRSRRRWMLWAAGALALADGAFAAQRPAPTGSHGVRLCTFGDDARNFLGVPARIARANHARVNDVIKDLAARHGKLADIHAHFLTGDPSWFTHTIEPSLTGASEVRRVFLARL